MHNDTCYPALCVIGQYLDALKSGKIRRKPHGGDDYAVGRRVPRFQLYSVDPQGIKGGISAGPRYVAEFFGLEKGNGIEMNISLL